MKVQATLGRAALIAVLGFFGAVAAFATIAPSSEADWLPPSAVVIEPVPIRFDELRLPSPQSYIREERVQRGDTPAGVLSRLGIDDAVVQRLLRAHAIGTLRPGYSVTADVGAGGELRAMTFLTARDTLVQILPGVNGFREREQPARLQVQVAMKTGVVRSSLFAATDAAGIPDGVALQLADIFGGDIDFHRDLRAGDRFTVVYEAHLFAGRAVRAGRVLAAEFVNQGKAYRAVHFGTGYHAPDGKNLRKAFLRSPIEFSRVTSGFGMRVHPVLQSWRAHKGIDYAAPIGARVRAVGDAVVEYAGPKGGYGNVVMLRHHGQTMTVYAHLNRIAVRRGARVAQNQTVGFVGRTGWATGPHLHYEFRIAGEARNPFKIAMPAALPVAPQDMETFRGVADPLVARLELLANSNLALLE
jgi:murein DD-endopeptidase MepM/ murein hydrolase activator NlpD